MISLFSYSTFADTADTSVAAEQAPAVEHVPDAASATSDSEIATDSITISVTVNDEEVAGVGYRVNGKDVGGQGTSHTSTGPSNQYYAFGFRKKHRTGTHIQCGTHKLTQNSHVILTVDRNGCHSTVEIIEKRH